MTKRKSLLILIGAFLIVALGFLGYSVYERRQEQILQAQEQERIEQEEAEQQRIIQEQQAQEQARIDNIKSQLISGEYQDDLKVVFLTFDDGPNEYSNEVLDTLKRNDIKATFFTNGINKQGYEDIYKRIINEGHVLANHSYSHNYDFYNNTETFINDVIQQENYLRQVTGVEPVKVFRFPGGSNMTNMTNINALRALGYNYYDWTASAGDGATTILPTEGVISKIITDVHKLPVSVVLCHAETPEKTTSREALDPLISQLKSEGYTFMTLDPAYEISDSKFMVSD